jgi:hypothetical protein
LEDCLFYSGKDEAYLGGDDGVSKGNVNEMLKPVQPFATTAETEEEGIRGM